MRGIVSILTEMMGTQAYILVKSHHRCLRICAFYYTEFISTREDRLASPAELTGPKRALQWAISPAGTRRTYFSGSYSHCLRWKTGDATAFLPHPQSPSFPRVPPNMQENLGEPLVIQW